MFGKREQSGKLILVVGVEDGGVACALATMPHVGPARVIRAVRKTLSMGAHTGDERLAGISTLLKETVDAFSKDTASFGAPKRIYVIVHEPWTRFRTVQSKETWDAPQTITKDTITARTKDAFSQIKDLDSSRILESGVMQVFLNGYHTGKPIGKKASALSVVAFMSDIDPRMRGSVETILGATYPGITLSIRSGLHELLSIAHEKFPDIPRFVMVSINGASSTCSVVRKDLLTQHVVVPEGYASILTRASADGLPEETLTLIRMIASDACATPACEKAKQSLAVAEPELVKKYAEAFASLATERPLPNVCLLAAPSDIAPYLEGFFSRIDFSQFSATAQPLDVEILTPEHLFDVVVWDETLSPSAEISCLAFYAHILEQSTS